MVNNFIDQVTHENFELRESALEILINKSVWLCARGILSHNMAIKINMAQKRPKSFSMASELDYQKNVTYRQKPIIHFLSNLLK